MDYTTEPVSFDDIKVGDFIEAVESYENGDTATIAGEVVSVQPGIVLTKSRSMYKYRLGRTSLTFNRLTPPAFVSPWASVPDGEVGMLTDPFAGTIAVKREGGTWASGWDVSDISDEERCRRNQLVRVVRGEPDGHITIPFNSGVSMAKLRGIAADLARGQVYTHTASMIEDLADAVINYKPINN